MIKKITLLLLLAVVTEVVFAQEVTQVQEKMKLVGKKIYLGNRPLSISDARDLSVTLPEAYLYFNKAKRVKDWKYF